MRAFHVNYLVFIWTLRWQTKTKTVTGSRRRNGNRWVGNRWGFGTRNDTMHDAWMCYWQNGEWLTGATQCATAHIYRRPRNANGLGWNIFIRWWCWCLHFISKISFSLSLRIVHFFRQQYYFFACDAFTVRAARSLLFGFALCRSAPNIDFATFNHSRQATSMQWVLDSSTRNSWYLTHISHDTESTRRCLIVECVVVSFARQYNERKIRMVCPALAAMNHGCGGMGAHFI